MWIRDSYYVNVATDAEGKETRRVKVTVVTQNENEAVVGKTQVKRYGQVNEINAGVPTTKLRDGDTLVMLSLIHICTETVAFKRGGTFVPPLSRS